MKRALLLIAMMLPATAFAASATVGGLGTLKSEGATVATPIACDFARERLSRGGWYPQSRTQCYRGCLGHRVRAYCNRWCDNHCRY